MPIKGLIFDAYGTLYDVHSVHTKTEELCPGKGDLITQIWRLKQLEYTWLQTALRGYRDFGFLTEASLVFALRAAGVESSERIIKPLLGKYLDLDPFPEAKEALGALKRRGGYQLAILSNGSTAMLTALVKNSGLDAFLNETISVDGARKFKPHPMRWSRKGSVSRPTRCCSSRRTASMSPARNISASRSPGLGAAGLPRPPGRSGRRKCIGCCAAVPKPSATHRITLWLP
jgi:2-haloalkanoic acid dehalogenase type II